MKILIIGSNGQLGTDCCLLLAPTHTLITPSLDQLNFCHPETIDQLLSRERPEVIINCAAYTAVDRCEQEKGLCRSINADGPRRLAQVAERIRARLIHISTDYVFSGLRPAPEPYTEVDETEPLSEYGKTKFAGEEAIRSECADHIILRTAWLYSAHGPNFLKTMLRLTVQNPEREIKVVDDQFGSLTWSHTLARQIERLLTIPVRGLFHATADGYSTWYGGACAFLDAMGIQHRLQPCTTADYPTLARRPLNSILANVQLDKAGLSTFGHWRDDLDAFVLRYKERLLAEARTT